MEHEYSCLGACKALKLEKICVHLMNLMIKCLHTVNEFMYRFFFAIDEQQRGALRPRNRTIFFVFAVVIVGSNGILNCPYACVYMSHDKQKEIKKENERERART